MPHNPPRTLIKNLIKKAFLSYNNGTTMWRMEGGVSCGGMTTKNDDDVGHALVLISHRENMCALLKHGRHGNKLTLSV